MGCSFQGGNQQQFFIFIVSYIFDLIFFSVQNTLEELGIRNMACQVYSSHSFFSFFVYSCFPVLYKAKKLKKWEMISHIQLQFDFFCTCSCNLILYTFYYIFQLQSTLQSHRSCNARGVEFFRVHFNILVFISIILMIQCLKIFLRTLLHRLKYMIRAYYLDV